MLNADEGRYLIAQHAQSQLAAHYLPGARGGIPGGPAVLGRSVKLEYNRSWSKLQIHAGSNTLGPCWGKYKRTGHLVQPDSQELKRLKDYASANKDRPGTDWPHFEKYGISPRRIEGEGSAIALSEDCRNRRHFDCIGFIFWALNEVMPWIAWWERGIPQYAQKNDTLLDNLGLISGSQLRPGDICVRLNTDPKHIGIAVGPGTVVHASREDIGVVVQNFSEGKWTSVSRVKAECFA